MRGSPFQYVDTLTVQHTHTSAYTQSYAHMHLYIHTYTTQRESAVVRTITDTFTHIYVHMYFHIHTLTHDVYTNGPQTGRSMYKHLKPKICLVEEAEVATYVHRKSNTQK